MKSFFLFLSTLLVSSAVQAGGHQHSPDVCTVVNPTCLHIGYHDELTTAQPADLKIHFISAPDFSLLKNVSAKLALVTDAGMVTLGNLNLEQIAVNKFMARQVVFNSVGLWNVLVQFEMNGQVETLPVPLEVAE